MSYATRADLIARFGEREVMTMTDRSLTGQIDEAVLDAALAAADAEIDGYLGGRYPLPLPAVPRILTGYACDIARYRMVGADAFETEPIRQRYRDAIKFLEQVAAGKITLGGMPDGSVAKPGNTIAFVPGSKVFGRDGGAM